MSEEGIDDSVERGLRQLLAVGGQIAERLARAVQEIQRRERLRGEQASQEYQQMMATNRAAMQAVVAPVKEPEWWSKASAHHVADAYQAAESWKNHDPMALEASARIQQEVKSRYGIDTDDLQGDLAYLHDAVLMKQQGGPALDELVKQTEEKVSDKETMRATLASTTDAQWWDNASPDQVSNAYQAAEVWKDRDVVALEASTLIRDEVKTRYGVDTDDIQGDTAYLRDVLWVQRLGGPSAEQVRKNTEAMTLIAAAQRAEMLRQAEDLRGEQERLQVPQEYMTDPKLLDALQAARSATEAEVQISADRLVAERVHLLNEDGLQGPTIEQLREEISSNYSGTDESLFQDAGFVEAAREWHEARVLAEGGFESKDNALEARYEASEKELFARIETLGHDIEKEVLKDQHGSTGAENSGTSTDGSPVVKYGSVEHTAAFAKNLEGTGTPEEIKGRLIAAVDQGRHPREAVRSAPTLRAQPAKRPTVGVGRESSKGGPTR